MSGQQEQAPQELPPVYARIVVEYGSSETGGTNIETMERCRYVFKPQFGMLGLFPEDSREEHVLIPMGLVVNVRLTPALVDAPSGIVTP